ncbi:hypothetical protein Bbelb_286760 [Branchiostoma belcheri]|nr:hypothetical protein Bbelb_286760 [Branchiostoma belcheri]
MASQEGVPSAYNPDLTVNFKPSKSSSERGKSAGETGLHLKLLKLFLSVLLGLVVLASFTLSQLSAISLVKFLGDENATCGSSNSTDELKATSGDVTSLMVVYMLMIPYGVSFLRSVWNGAFQDSIPWPHYKAIGLNMLSYVVVGRSALSLTSIVRRFQPYL